MITIDNKGGRTIELFLPFKDAAGKDVVSITLAPFTLGHTLAWQAGEYKSILQLLTTLTGLPEFTVKLLRYPDADRVMTAFFSMLPPDVLGSIQEGIVPRAQPPTTPAEESLEQEPLAPEGFALGDEPHG